MVAQPGMSRFVRHTALNAVAFATVAALQLAVVPVFVRTYGFSGLGELALVRLLMPSALFGVLLSGLPTLTVRYAAMNRAQGHRINGAGVIVAGAIGIAVGMILGGKATAETVMRLLGRPDVSASVSNMRPLLASSQLILFPGVVLQAILQGMEKYPALRITELWATFGLLIAALIGSYCAWPLEFVLSAFILLQISKCLLQALVAFSSGSRLAMRAPRLEDFAALRHDIAVYGPNNFIGGLVTHLPAVLISALAGPVALGQFEAARRIPQALKVLVGLINSAVLPRASALAADQGRRRLGEFTLRVSQVSSLVTLAMFIPLMGLSQFLIILWLGPHFSDLSTLLVLMLMEGALSVTPATLDTVAAADPHTVARQTVLRALEGSLLIVASGCLMLPSGLAIFLTANVIIAALGLLARRLVVTPLLGISSKAWTSMIIRRGAPLIAATLPVALLLTYLPLPPIASVVLGLLVIWFLAALAYKVTLPQQEQVLLLKLVSAGLIKR
jgi:O-antigen/teichoic acid export membrane protein